MEKPQFWILKNKKGRPFSLKTSFSRGVEIPEKTVEKIFSSFLEIAKEHQSRKKERLNLYLGVKPKNETVEVKFFVSNHEKPFYRSKNSPWRFFLIPSSRIKEIKVEFQKEPKVLFRFEV